MQTARIANAEYQDIEKASPGIGRLDKRGEEWRSGVSGSDAITADGEQFVEDRSRTVEVALSVSAQTIAAFYDRLIAIRLERIQQIITGIYSMEELTKNNKRWFLRLWWRWGLIAKSRPQFELK